MVNALSIIRCSRVFRELFPSIGRVDNSHSAHQPAGDCFCILIWLECTEQDFSNCVKKGCSAICPDGENVQITDIAWYSYLVPRFPNYWKGKQARKIVQDNEVDHTDLFHGRFVLANTEDLHDKIGQLSNRVRALEDALAESHASVSHDPHPLLTEELLRIKHPLERERPNDAPPKEEQAEVSDPLDSMGSLWVVSVNLYLGLPLIFLRAISEKGRSTFFGQTANSWVRKHITLTSELTYSLWLW